ncbi:MAG: DoxX family protein [Deltaproteobacteria bacterium]|nr:DoxX family protein [Deltaproteobacteria bacterium]
MAVKAYGILISIGDLFLQHLILLVFRLHWGWQFYTTGKAKLVNHSDVAAFFGRLGIPAPSLNAWFVGGLECIGGVLLMIGLMSRPIALLLSVTMAVAYISVEKDREAVLNLFTDPDPFLSAEPFFFLLTALLVLAFGPGYLSLDAFFKKKHYDRDDIEL